MHQTPSVQPAITSATLCLILLALYTFCAHFATTQASPNNQPDQPRVQLLLDETSRQQEQRQHQLEQSQKKEEPFVELNNNGNQWTPVVFWHGMGDTAFGSINIDRLALQRHFPGIEVLSIQMGNSPYQDQLASYFSNVNHQVEQACQEVLASETIRRHGSFNAIGFSQGAQFLRALIQRCPLKEKGIRVKNFISLGGQHEGVFGLPNCNSHLFCDYIRQLLSEGAYRPDVQQHLVQAEYWHDPLQATEYAQRNIFLADINNERTINSTYKANLLALDKLVLVEFLHDEMVVPRESSLFGFYAPGQANKIVPLEESALYLEDRLGLRQMQQEGRLIKMSVPGGHLQYKMAWFLAQIADVYLNN